MRTSDFDYELPDGLIAQRPAEPRDAARLLVLEPCGQISHRVFRDLPELLRPSDVVVANRTRVLPARLEGRRVPSGGRFEALLLREREPGTWEALVRPASRLRPGALVEIGQNGASVLAEVGERLASGARELRLRDGASATPRALALGRPPLPPYIKGWSGVAERYQTVYGDRVGSAAAPTAGLHFTRPLLE